METNTKITSRTRMTAGERRTSMNFARIGAFNAVIGFCCISGNVLSLVAIKLGAREMFLGLLSVMLTSTWAFRIFTMSAVEKHGKRRVLIFWKSISTLCIIPFLFIPLVAGKWPTTICLSIILIATLARVAAYALGNTGWFPLLHDIVPRQITGRFFANLRMTWQTAHLLTLLGISFFLGHDPAWWKFELVFIVALVAYAIRTLCIIPMVENPRPETKHTHQPIAKRFSEVFAVKELRMLALYMARYMIAATIANPFKIKFLKDLEYSDAFVLAATSMISVGALVSLYFWGKLADRFGNRAILTITHIGMPISTVLWVFVDADSKILVFALFLIWSIFNSGTGIALIRLLLHTIAADKQNQINVIYVISDFSMGLAPLLAGFMLTFTAGISIPTPFKTINNYHLFFVATALMFILPHLAIRGLKRTKEASTMQVIAIMARPILNTLAPFIRTATRSKSQEDTKKRP